MVKRSLSERDICTRFITPALQAAGWDLHSQIREEVTFTAGRIIVSVKLHTRGKSKRADYVLYRKPNLPIAVIKAKDNTRSTVTICSRRSTIPSSSIPFALVQNIKNQH